METSCIRNTSFIFGGAEFDQEYKFQFWWNRVLSGMQVLFFDGTDFSQEEKLYVW